MMMTVGGSVSAEILALTEEFETNYAPYMGWENPFQKDINLSRNKLEAINGIKIWWPQNVPKEEMTTREEKDLWILRRDRFVMNRLLDEFSYETAKEWAKNSYCSERLLEELSQKTPCEVGDRQCSFDCAQFGTCGEED